MWKSGLALLCALAWKPVHADLATGNALVIGNARYGDSSTAFGLSEVQAVARALRLRGQEVEALANGGRDPMSEAFHAFLASIDEDETPLIVVLSGKFGRGPDGVHLLPAGRGHGAGGGSAADRGLSISTILTVLAKSPRRAFLALGDATGPDNPGAGAWPDLDDLDIPAGVTVIRGPAGKVAQFAAREMARPGARLVSTADAYGLRLRGHVTDSLVVLEHTEVRPPTAAEQAAARSRARQLDDLAWQRATAANTPGSYRTYLDSFPEGRHAATALAMEDEAALALDADGRMALQRDLASLGYRTGGVDGILGPVTRAAIAAWQEHQGTTGTGYLDAAQIAQIAQQAAARSTIRPGARRAAVAAEDGPPRTLLSSQEAAIWRRARGEEGLRGYLRQFPDGAYADRARVLLSNGQRGSRR